MSGRVLIKLDVSAPDIVSRRSCGERVGSVVPYIQSIFPRSFCPLQRTGTGVVVCECVSASNAYPRSRPMDVTFFLLFTYPRSPSWLFISNSHHDQEHHPGDRSSPFPVSRNPLRSAISTPVGLGRGGGSRRVSHG